MVSVSLDCLECSVSDSGMLSLSLSLSPSLACCILSLFFSTTRSRAASAFLESDRAGILGAVSSGGVSGDLGDSTCGKSGSFPSLFK